MDDDDDRFRCLGIARRRGAPFRTSDHSHLDVSAVSASPTGSMGAVKPDWWPDWGADFEEHWGSRLLRVRAQVGTGREGVREGHGRFATASAHPAPASDGGCFFYGQFLSRTPHRRSGTGRRCCIGRCPRYRRTTATGAASTRPHPQPPSGHVGPHQPGHLRGEDWPTYGTAPLQNRRAHVVEQ